MKYSVKLLVLQNMLACCYLSKALWDPRKTSIKADVQHGYTVKHNHKCPGTLSPCKCSLPSPLLLLPPFFNLFSTTAGSDPHHLWELSLLFSFSVAVTAAGDTGCVPGSPSHSTLALVWVRGLPFPIFFFLFLQRINNLSSTFWSFWKAHVTLACRGHVSLVLYQTELVCWRMKCPINLSSSTIWWGKSCIDWGHVFHFFRKPHLQQWLGNLPNPHTDFLFPAELPSTPCSIGILLPWWGSTMPSCPVLGTVGKYICYALN